MKYISSFLYLICNFMNRDIVVGKYTLETLTNGMYSNPLDLYREYIQNAVDSIDEKIKKVEDTVEHYKIDIQIEPLSGTISIRDNGEGIAFNIAEKSLVDIGNSDKDKKKSRGFRGIGRLSGLGYCNELVFTTSYQGEEIKTIVKFDTCLLRKLLFSRNKDIVSVNDVMKKIITIEKKEENINEHYFEVELNGVSNKEKLLDENFVENYLIQHIPLPFKKEFVWASEIKEKYRLLGYEIPEYNISLNGKTLFKPYEMHFLSDRVKKRQDTISDIKVIPFYREEKISAVLWYGVTGCYGTILDNKLKGIRIRQGNMLIGDRGTCNGLFKEERFNGWMIGELHVFDNDLVVNARRDYFEQNEAYYDLSETFKEWSTSKSREIRKISYERTLSEKKKAIVNASDSADVNDLFTEDLDCCGESDFIDREEVDEISEIDYMDKLSWIINQKQGKTKYMALNINNRLTAEQKKMAENIFDIVIQKYQKDEAEKFINIIASNL